MRAMGETVRKGQLLFTLYSPMLESAQQEYLDALQIGNDDLIAASRDRLRALGLDAGTASRLAKSGRAAGRVAFHAPIAGVVTELEAREGAMLSPDMVAMTITELGSLWVIAEVPESQSAWLRAGHAGRGPLPVAAGRARARQGRVRLSRTQHGDAHAARAHHARRPPAGVRPNMLANVELLGDGGAEVLNIPRSALIRGGGKTVSSSRWARAGSPRARSSPVPRAATA